AGSERPPNAVSDAKRLWVRAEQDAKRGQLLAAAAAFVDAAGRLKLPADHFYGDVAKAARAYAYENAVTCWVAAGAKDLARRRLAEAAAAHRDLEEQIAEALERVE